MDLCFNKENFLKQVEAVSAVKGISLFGADGYLTVSNFHTKESCKVTAYIREAGQLYISGKVWRKILKFIRSVTSPSIDIIVLNETVIIKSDDQMRQIKLSYIDIFAE